MDDSLSTCLLTSMSVRETVFLRLANYILDRVKGYFNTFHSQILFKLAILYLKFHKCQILRLGKCLVLPIGADAHGVSHIWKSLPLHDVLVLATSCTSLMTQPAPRILAHFKRGSFLSPIYTFWTDSAMVTR